VPSALEHLITIKPSLPQGTRDFSTIETAKRKFIFDTIREVFELFGYSELQTPALEHLSTLTGKYGDEGDQLIFKIINSGDFLSKVTGEELGRASAKDLLLKISERALRYDLTVPLARYVVTHQNELSFPFKRYQIQPVWRADRPQKGRYREFYQCDADCVGSTSLLCEAELISLYDRALVKLKIPDAVVRINNRKVLGAIAEKAGHKDKFNVMVTAIDKLDKIGASGVNLELTERGFSAEEIDRITPFWSLAGSNENKLSELTALLSDTRTGLEGVAELKAVLDRLKVDVLCQTPVEITLSLARGLNYYTGTIFEVYAKDAAGSIGGGGRYDDLTGIFGLEGLTGVGISFGADRIYDLMSGLDLFPANSRSGPNVMIANFYEPATAAVIGLAYQLRAKGISCLLYPDLTKLNKQMKHASRLMIPYVIFIGEDEYKNEQVMLKDMTTGEQETLDQSGLIEKLGLLPVFT